MAGETYTIIFHGTSSAKIGEDSVGGAASTVTTLLQLEVSEPSTPPPPAADVAVKRYGTRGPFLPGMCSRLNCDMDKTHTVVVENLGPQSATVDVKIMVDAVPSNICTVNGVGAGGALDVASGILLDPGARFSQNIDLFFQCSPASNQFIGQDYVLRAHVESVDAGDPNPDNNDEVKTQTVK